jgi:hypothetical protein
MVTALIGPGSAVAGDRYYDKHGYGRHHPYQRYGGHPYRKHHHKHNYRRYDSDDDEKLLYGLLVGGLFGYVIGHNQQPAPAQGSYYPPPPPPPQYSPRDHASSCLQEREYQMKVMVGGKEVDAYGTACLQPDGSWSRGPATLVSR